MAEIEVPDAPQGSSRRFRRRRKRQDGEPSAIDLIEEGVYLLRQTSVTSWAVYASGVAPFVLGFLYFWTEMASSGLANQVLLPGSFLLAVLYFWLKLTQAFFAKGLREALYLIEEPPWEFSLWLKVFRRQLFWQSTGFVVLPIAAVLTFPFAWASAFYQNIVISNPQDELPDNEWVSENWRLARIWHEQNWILLTLLGCVFFLSFLNLLTVVGMVPYLLKTLLGIDTVFSRAGIHLFNSTTLFACMLLAFVATDPLVKAVFLLRLHYCASRKSGADMLLRLRRAKFPGSLGKLVVILSMLAVAPFLHPVDLLAQEEKVEEWVTAFESDALETSINEVLQRREFVWRFPREATEQESKKEWEWLKSLAETLKDWAEKLDRWLDRFWRSDRDNNPNKSWGDGWAGFAGMGPFLSYLLIGLFILLVLYFAVRAWKMYQPLDTVKGTHENETVATPDLNEDDIAADLLPMNRWLELARKLIANGEFRLALRAYFLAQLSELSHQGIIVIRQSKSNREYAREIARRAHGQDGLLEVYKRQVHLFESNWYGERHTGPDEVFEMEGHLSHTGVLP